MVQSGAGGLTWIVDWSQREHHRTRPAVGAEARRGDDRVALSRPAAAVLLDEHVGGGPAVAVDEARCRTLMRPQK